MLEFVQKKRQNADKFVTVYFQGTTSSRSYGALYAGRDGIHIDGEYPHHAYAPLAPQYMYNPFSYKELRDVAYGPTWSPINWAFKLRSYMVKKIYGIEQHYHAFPVWSKMDIAGVTDVAQHQHAVRDCVSKMQPEQKLVLYGTSRGASTTIVSVATMPPELQAKISLVILEAPFDKIESVTYRYERWCLSTFALYDPKQMSPLDAVKFFPLSIPVGFITSNNDTKVPRCHTEKLINELRRRKHPHVYHLNLNDASHCGMPMSSLTDQWDYKTFVEELYDLIS